ncbi:MAG: CHAT domain-containing protein, partial [Flammeovirgaceae bacterium]
MTKNTTNKKPVIFLAFANDRVDDAAYLRNLPKEMSGIRDALQKAVKAGLCEVVERANATIDQILNIFQDAYYKDRIGIFHYGGHANGYQLLLETMEGEHAAAHSEGLVSFLAKQQGLKAIFLNGCSSEQQALDLVAAGIPAVIGTSQSINDDVATSLAIRFYSALGNGSNLSRAWAEAVDQVKIQKGTANMRDLFFDGMDEPSTSENEDRGTKNASLKQDRFPWDIYYREGAELVKQWNLPETVENPLFGLPEPDRQNLPDQPFRFLERYKREHADIFFGRSYYIRDLFNTATDDKAAPVILFYGQSGVGKSSMLDAGLFPRLEQVAQVVYIRRKQRLGLLGTLKRALGVSKHQAENIKSYEGQAGLKIQISQLEEIIAKSSGDVEAKLNEVLQDLTQQLAQEEAELAEKAKEAQISDASSLLEVWLHAEKEAEKPLIILLDQAEECFTRPNKNMPDELNEFLGEIQQIFGYPKNRPQGKIILSYRKEYHPEINEACKNFSIPREETFLRALERKDIIEVIIGLTKTERLQRKYRLEVEETLPIVIADDLLEDKDSPIAPVLQILLTKMWKISEAENDDHHFSVDHYQTLRTQGILMDDFFKEQMEVLDVKYPEQVKSGLALDVLDNHTTKMGTADSRHLDELRERYADRQEIIDKLLKEFKRLYLLTDIGADTTGLAHDTLAPLVQDEFRHSAKPGQRAALILENKMIAYEQEPETVIDIDDLKIVEEGAGGMRLWTVKEQELIDKSRGRRKQLEFEKKRNRYVVFGLLGLIFIGLIAGWLWTNLNKNQLAKAKVVADQAKVDAENQARIAEEERKKADSAKVKAVEQANIAEKATAAATKSAELARLEQEKALASAQVAEEERKKAEVQKVLADSAKVKAERQAEIADKARTEAEIAQKDAIEKGNVANKQLYLAQAREIAIKSSLMQDNDTLKALLAIRAYELEKAAFNRFKNKDEEVDNDNDAHEIFEAMERAVKKFNQDSLLAGESWDFEVDGQQVILSNERGQMVFGEIIPQKDGKLPRFGLYRKINAVNPKARVYAITHLPGTNIAYGTSDGTVVIEDGSTSKVLYQHQNANVLSIIYATEKNWVLSTADDHTVIAWDLTNNQEIERYTHDVPINYLQTYKDYVFGIDRRGHVLFWELGLSGKKPIVLWEHPNVPLVSLAYSPKYHWLAFGASNGEIFVMSVDQPETIRKFNKMHKGKVSELVFSPKQKFLASASFDGTLMSWKLDNANANLQKLT